MILKRKLNALALAPYVLTIAGLLTRPAAPAHPLLAGLGPDGARAVAVFLWGGAAWLFLKGLLSQINRPWILLALGMLYSVTTIEYGLGGPWLFGHLCFLGQMKIFLDGERGRRGALFLSPILLGAWANLDGGYPIGALAFFMSLLAVATTSIEGRSLYAPLALLGLAGAMAPVLTPAGPAGVVDAFRGVMERAPASADASWVTPALIGGLLALIGFALLRWRRRDPMHWPRVAFLVISAALAGLDRGNLFYFVAGNLLLFAPEIEGALASF